MSMLAHCCEQFLLGLDLPARSPALCPICRNQIVFDIVDNSNEIRPNGPVLRQIPENEYQISHPEYLEKQVTIYSKEYDIASDWDAAVIQRNILNRYLTDFPVYSDKRYRNSVSVIKAGMKAKAVAKTSIIS
jgi:hypothetical protein